MVETRVTLLITPRDPAGRMLGVDELHRAGETWMAELVDCGDPAVTDPATSSDASRGVIEVEAVVDDVSAVQAVERLCGIATRFRDAHRVHGVVVERLTLAG